MNPIGWDSFGLPAENAAIQRGSTRRSGPTQHRDARGDDAPAGLQLGLVAAAAHLRPEYYKWTQWLFLQLFEAGWAYRKDANVNWCPS
jgi:leucyl-tRNA synthetase